MTKINRDVPVLSGIRGLAALTVFASHSSGIYYQGRVFGFGGGQIGVMLFFMLSGYLMSMLYMQTAPSRQHAKQFFVHRFARIYPMFAFVVLADFALTHANIGLVTYGVARWVDVARNLFLISGNGPFWTIGPEVIFYVIFASLWFTKSLSRNAYVLALVFLLLIGMWPGNSQRTYSLIILHQRIPYFLAGMVLGSFHNQLEDIKRTMTKPLTCLVAGALPVAYFVSYPNISALIHPLPKEMGADPSMTMWSFPFFLVLIAFLLVGSLLTEPRVLTNRTALFMGKISFPFYLLHIFFLVNVQRLLPIHPIWSIALSLIGCAVTSYLLHLAVEVPARRLIRKWGHHSSVSASAHTAVA